MGKTFIFSELIRNHLKKGGKAIVFTHRGELLKQAFKNLPNAEIIDANSKPDLTKNLHIAMVETANRRDIDDFLATRTLIINDEAHLSNFDKLFPYFNPDAIVIGATATPYRKGSKVAPLSDFYTYLAQEVQTHELIEMGYLAQAKSYGVPIDLSNAKKKGTDYDTSEIYSGMYSGVVSEWMRLTPRMKTLLFSSNVKNSKEVCSEFKLRGFDAKHIDGNTPSKKRVEILDWFSNTSDAILCNCGILTAGYDEATIETIILYRATTSVPLFYQMCGRGSRRGPETFNILDFGNNFLRFGLWEAPVYWNLQNDKKPSTKQDAGVLKICPGCSALLYVSVSICPHCDHKFVKTKKEMFAELLLLPKFERNDYAKSKSLEDKAELAKAKVINGFWVLHGLSEIEDARKFCNLMGYHKNFEYINKNRFKVFQDGD